MPVAVLSDERSGREVIIGNPYVKLRRDRYAPDANLVRAFTAFKAQLERMCRVGGRRRAPHGRGRLALVSSRPPSNRACGSPAHGSPMSFTVGVR